MKKSLLVVVLAAGMAVGIVASASSADTPGKRVVAGNADDSKYKEIAPGVSKAMLWGNPEKGPYGAYTKFKPGLDNGMHTHTSDVWLVVIKGAYLYKDDAGEKRVAPGGFMRIPAKHKHWSGGDAKEGALFYEEASGKFDLIPSK